MGIPPFEVITDPNPESAIAAYVAEGGSGVYGNGNRVGLFGKSERNTGVHARSIEAVGLVAEGGHLAARFNGDVEVTGDIRLLNADCAEEFDVDDVALAEPGTVMVFGTRGMLLPSRLPYDKRVAGVISGAGSYKPGIVLDNRESNSSRRAIALLGKVFCKVDAGIAPVDIGDLLTTSTTLGHAMKAIDTCRSFGSVLGKAMSPLSQGRGLLPVLVALR
jgi:hypothetical protein